MEENCQASDVVYKCEVIRPVQNEIWMLNKM